MKCKALTGKGTPCRNEALPGSDYCYISAHQMLENLPEPEQEEPLILVPKPEPVETACGHVNMHARLPDGDGGHYYPVCDLEKGHKGDHSAAYQRIDYKNQGIALNELSRTHWKDIAGTPANEIAPDLYSLPKNHPQHPDFEEYIALVRH